MLYWLRLQMLSQSFVESLVMVQGVGKPDVQAGLGQMPTDEHPFPLAAPLPDWAPHRR